MIVIEKSNREGKRFKTKINNKTYHFGSLGAFTYIDGADKKTRENYIKRHQVREDWTKINSGSLSRFILWGDSQNINKNLIDFSKRFKGELSP